MIRNRGSCGEYLCVSECKVGEKIRVCQVFGPLFAPLAQKTRHRLHFLQKRRGFFWRYAWFFVNLPRRIGASVHRAPACGECSVRSPARADSPAAAPAHQSGGRQILPSGVQTSASGMQKSAYGAGRACTAAGRRSCSDACPCFGTTLEFRSRRGPSTPSLFPLSTLT